LAPVRKLPTFDGDTVTGEVGARHRGDVEARGCERREARFDIIRPSCAFPCDPFPCL